MRTSWIQKRPNPEIPLKKMVVLVQKTKLPASTTLVENENSVVICQKVGSPVIAKMVGGDQTAMFPHAGSRVSMEESASLTKMGTTAVSIAKMVGRGPSAMFPPVGSRVKMEECASSTKMGNMPATAQPDGEDQLAVRMSTNVTNKLWVYIGITNKPLYATKDSVRILWGATSVPAIQDMEEMTVQHGRAATQNLVRIEAGALSLQLGMGGHIQTQSDATALLPSLVISVKKKTTATAILVEMEESAQTRTRTLCATVSRD